MSKRSAVVLVADRVGAGYLGPYGNTWVETPEFNRLASQSMLFENMVADSADLARLYDSFLYGTHAMGGPPETGRLPTVAVEAGAHTCLLTDETDLAQAPLAADFSERIHVATADSDQAAPSIDATRLGQLFDAALEWLARTESPFLLWLHASALAGPWDAPREFRERFADEEDPPPPSFVQPPDRQLPKNFDPDEALGVNQAYAGQILLLDMCLGTLLDALEERSFASDTAVLFTSPRGFPLGEHGCLGSCGDQLHGEVLHAPLLIRYPTQDGAGQRFPALVQPGDVHATLADWLELPVQRELSWGQGLRGLNDDESSWRQCAFSIGPRQRSIRTPAWFLCETESQPSRLYVKPDDRWEVNEVADLCGEVPQELLSALHQFHQSARSGRADVPELSALLTHGLE